LSGNTKRQAGAREVDELRQENEQLKQLVAQLALMDRGQNMCLSVCAPIVLVYFSECITRSAQRKSATSLGAARPNFPY
jgi:hypothetical protein